MNEHTKAGSGDPHARQPIELAGPDPESAEIALILVHGRGASARDILGLYAELGLARVAAIAPQAAGSTWYPNSFMAPIASNEPFLDSALRRIESIVLDLLARGIASDRIALLGFSQGACLALEFALRHPRRYAGVMGLTGGLIGPPGTVWEPAGSLAGTRVFLGAGDPDPHVPYSRVEETERVMRRAGAEVETRRYPGLPHTINRDELEACREILLGASSR